jgi:serine/threonine-protein kinase
MYSQTLPTGKLLADRYRIDAFLAEGGMALVYRAHDLRLQRDVAVKVVKPEFATSQGYEQDFVAEARVAASVNHPNLVNVFDQGVDNGLDFMVMELVEGRTLREIMARFGKIDEAKALEVVRSILSGLAALHRQGLVHRDIKPENVILANDGRIKLTDFGLARPSRAQAGGPLLGTAAYLAPELLSGAAADARADVYSVGIVLYELLVGAKPFEAEDSNRLAQMHSTHRVPAPGVSQLTDWLVQKATAQNPTDRFSNASAMLNAMAGSPAPTNEPTRVIADATEVVAMYTEVIGASEAQALGEEPKRPRRLATWLAMTLSAILLGLGVGWWFGTGPGAMITLPKVSAMTLTEAKATLSAYPIKITTSEENSDTVAVGTVINTDPAGGSLVLRDSKITLRVSLGPKLSTIPNLKGKNLVDATAAIVSAGFALGGTSEAFNPAPLGTVYDYSGADGTIYPPGTKVDLKISLGPIPAVNGLSESAARIAITAVGLNVGQVTQAYSDTISRGNVISLAPETADPGKGGVVDLVISKGTDKVIMPKVIGETIAASQLALQNLGLKVVVDTNVLSSRWGIAKVKSASAAAGSTLRIGDTVTIISR